jgi:hypothetical protein
MTLKHQYDSKGSHRIVKLDVAGFLEKSGEWAGYNNLATYTINNIQYIAATDYYAGTLEPNVIYQLSKTDFKSEVK